MLCKTRQRPIYGVLKGDGHFSWSKGQKQFTTRSVNAKEAGTSAPDWPSNLRSPCSPARSCRARRGFCPGFSFICCGQKRNSSDWSGEPDFGQGFCLGQPIFVKGCCRGCLSRFLSKVLFCQEIPTLCSNLAFFQLCVPQLKA